MNIVSYNIMKTPIHEENAVLKTLTTLIRGTVAEADDAMFDANAIRILAQQLRDAAEALELTRRELSCAMAHKASEARAIEALDKRSADLEAGALDAIRGGREDLAGEVATVMAAIADERRDRQEAVTRFETEIARLRGMAEDGRRRLDELKRGLELARAREALRRAGSNGRRALASGSGALREAEATLARIRSAHARDEDCHLALDDLERTDQGRDLDERLAAAGFGSSPRTRGADVLARLVAKARQAAPGSPGPSALPAVTPHE